MSILIHPLTEADVEFEIECLPEHIPVRGNAMASDDPDLDREQEDSIIRDLENGNEWAWCCVKVTASWNGFVGTDYLGGCSYKSEEDFKACDYFEDMKGEALSDLNSHLESLVGSLSPIIRG